MIGVRKEKIMAIKDWVFLVLGVSGAFSFGYTVGRQSVWNDMMNIFAGYSKSAGKEKDTDTDTGKDGFYA